jgi:hypothetical protein
MTDIHDILSYKQYRKLFSIVQRLNVHKNNEPMSEKEFLNYKEKNPLFKYEWGEFIFFEKLKCPDCGADLQITFDNGQLELEFLKHNI